MTRLPPPTAYQQVAFLRKLQRLLNEGSFVATYKFALPLAIADVCIDKADRDDGEPLTIQSRELAEKFASLYWRQAAPYPVPGGAPVVLAQNTGGEAAVVRALREQRERYSSLAKLRADTAAWRALVGTIDRRIKVMPLWKLQTIGSTSDDFLYPNIGSGSEITLRPGVAYCHRRARRGTGGLPRRARRSSTCITSASGTAAAIIGRRTS